MLSAFSVINCPNHFTVIHSMITNQTISPTIDVYIQLHLSGTTNPLNTRLSGQLKYIDSAQIKLKQNPIKSHDQYAYS